MVIVSEFEVPFWLFLQVKKLIAIIVVGAIVAKTAPTVISVARVQAAAQTIEATQAAAAAAQIMGGKVAQVFAWLFSILPEPKREWKMAAPHCKWQGLFLAFAPTKKLTDSSKHNTQKSMTLCPQQDCSLNKIPVTVQKNFFRPQSTTAKICWKNSLHGENFYRPRSYTSGFLPLLFFHTKYGRIFLDNKFKEQKKIYFISRANI